MMVRNRIFGRTREKISIIGLGTYGHGGAYGSISKMESFRIFRSVLSNIHEETKLLIDTAPRYGNGKVEKWLGEFSQDFKDRMLIATKCGRHIEHGRINEKDFSHDFLKKDLEGSLKRLNSNEIFLYQLHNPSLKIINNGSVFELLEKFADEGKIKYYGVSIDNPEEGVAAIDICKENGYKRLVALQVIYNILQKRADKELFPKAKKSRIAIIARETLFRGFLTSKYNIKSDFSKVPSAINKQLGLFGKERILSKIKEVKMIVKESGVNFPLSQVAIKFAISNPNVTVAIPGINRISYLKEDIGAAYINLGKKMLKKLEIIENITKR